MNKIYTVHRDHQNIMTVSSQAIQASKLAILSCSTDS